MKANDDRESAAVFDFVDEYLSDLEAGGARPLAHYLERHKGFEEAIAREFLTLRGHEARPAASAGAAAEDGERRIGPYRLLHELGRGGQGTVWLAEDVRIARKVALKVLASRFETISEEKRRRFRREAEVIARMEHASICPIYDADIECETPWIAMRYVEGRTLGQLLGEAREALAEGRIAESRGDDSQDSEVTTSWPPSSALDVHRTLLLFERCARALHAAHEAGVIHRDVKPGNLIVTPDGKPVILDFGLARDETSDLGSITESGELFGTPAYMSPEQLAGSSDALDRRTDVYSLGVALYEALTLDRPFDGKGKGNRAALHAMIREEPPPDPRSKNHALTLDIKVVLETALEKDRGRRYATAFELAEDLRRIREYEPIKARPASIPLRFARWTRRYPALAMSIIGTILALSGGLTVTSILNVELEDTNVELEKTIEELDDALQFALGKHLAQRCETLTREDPSAALVLGIQAVERAPNDLTRASLVEALESCRLAGVLEPKHGVLRDLALSPDGARVAVACRQVPNREEGGPVARWLPDEQGRIAIFDAETHASQAELDRPAAKAVVLAWVPSDGTLLAGYEQRTAESSEGGLALWDTAGKRVIRETRVALIPERMELSQNGATLLVVGSMVASTGAKPVESTPVPSTQRSSLLILDFATLTPRCSLQALPEHVDGARLTPDGSRVLFWHRASGTLSWRSTSTGETLPSDRVPTPFEAIDVDVSDGSLRIALGLSDGRVEVLDERLSRTWGDAIDPHQPVALVRWSGRKLFVIGADNPQRRDSARVREATGHVASPPLLGSMRVDLHWDGVPPQAACSPDGARVACMGSNNSIRIVELDTGASESFLTGFFRPTQIAWSKDGRKLFTRGVEPLAYVWHAQGAPHAPRLQPPTGSVDAGLLSDDGGRALVCQRAGEITLWRVEEASFASPVPLAGVSFSRAKDMQGAHGGLGRLDRAWTRIRGGFARPGGGPWTLDGNGELRAASKHSGAPAGCMRASGSWAGMVHSPDGLAHAGMDEGGRVHVLLPDEGTVRMVEFIPSPPSPVVAMALDTCGARLALGYADARLAVLDPRSGERLCLVDDVDDEGRARTRDVLILAAFRPGTDELAVFGSDTRVRFWDVRTGKKLRKETFLFREPRSLDYSRDGKLLLATGSGGGGAVRLLMLEPFAPVVFDTFHKSEITAGEISPDGRFVLTASRDGSVFVRESASGLMFARRVFAGREVVDAHFGGPAQDPNVIAVTDDGVVRVWPVDPLAAARSRFLRELREDEEKREAKLAHPLKYP